MYNFSDPTLNATSYTIAQNTGITNATTTVILAYNTASMLSTDRLSIVVDEIAEFVQPSEELLDPVQKQRVSMGQALIDTDFEYGLQPTKWESLVLVNNKPSFFVNVQTPLFLTNLVASANSTTVTANTSVSPPAIGQPVFITDTEWFGAQGGFIVTSNNTTANSFTFNAKYPFKGSDFNIFNSTLTQGYGGTFYTNANYNVSAISSVGNVITVTTVEPHGLTLRNGIYLTNGNSANVANGAYTVATVQSRNQFSVVSHDFHRNGLTTGLIYPRIDGGSQHRPFDGGVTMTTGTPSQNVQMIRQTRRYFRYQSGKGIQVSTGTILKPNFNVDDIRTTTLGGNQVEVTTKIPHNLNPGANIQVSGAVESGFNGNWVVQEIIDPVKFRYVSNTIPSTTIANGIVNVAVTNWYGATTRLGIFDSQNGLFFEYDGQTLYAVRRRSGEQLSSFINVLHSNSIVTGATVNGVTTKFTKQLVLGDFVVIRGQTYRIDSIDSDTQLRILPYYRGPSIVQPAQAIMSKTSELKVPQASWNLDKCDGTGPSGYNLDLTRMQMFYIDYSWYGAGSVRFGFRDTVGKVIYCHRFYNNNINFEAYMRSGNLPARYETSTYSPVTSLAATISSTETAVVTVANTFFFPNTGTLFVKNPLNYEFIGYTGKTANTFTGLTRQRIGATITANAVINSPNLITLSNIDNWIQTGQYIYGNEMPPGTFIERFTTGATGNVITLSQAALGTVTNGTYSIMPMGNTTSNVHTFNPLVPISVELAAPQFAPTISHWGTSVIMDGRFDDDKSFVFTYGETTDQQVPIGATYALISIRVAPSVDNGITGPFGSKELINRMQLVLRQLDVMTTGQFLVSLRLNCEPRSFGGNPGVFATPEVGSSSLSQICDHSGNVGPVGGETIYGFYAVNSSGSSNYETIQQDLNIVRDLGTSILGGGYTNTANVLGTYPDGPDVVTIVARNIGRLPANIQTRLCWTEAQA